MFIQLFHDSLHQKLKYREIRGTKQHYKGVSSHIICETSTNNILFSAYKYNLLSLSQFRRNTWY